MTKVKITLDGAYAKIDRAKSNQAMGQAMATKALAVTQRYVPMRTGDLRGTGKAYPFKVAWGPLPYARRVFYGVGLNFRTPGTMAHWDNGMRNHVAQIARVGEAVLKRGA